MSQLHIELVSPSERVFSRSAYAVALPSVEGEMTVLQSHAPTVCALDVGLVRLYAQSLSDKPEVYFVSGGFCDVSETGCTILAEQAMPQADLKVAELQAQLADVSARLDATEDSATKTSLTVQIQLLQAKLRFAV